MTDRPRRFASIGVRRFSEDGTTPIVVDHADACGTPGDHHAKGCIGLHVERGGSSSLVHLTNDEALRLSDLLRAMADTNTSQETPRE